MGKGYAESSLEAVATFKSLVKVPLQALLGGEVFSVEEEAQASAPIAQVLDTSASSDLVVRYQTSTAIYAAASRIMYETPKECEYPISITLRNSKSKSFAGTELNKLKIAADLLRSGVPVVVPRYLCYARVSPDIEPTRLHDLLAIETLPLVANVFDPAKLNLPGLRQRMEASGEESVLFDAKINSLAGIRTNSSDKSSTFVFLSKKYLDMNALPYLYQRL